MTKEAVEAAISSLEASLRTVDTWVLISAVVVAIALAAEAGLSISHWIKERELRPLRAQLSLLNEAELVTLRAAADDARAKAAEAELALAKYREPRHLTEAQVEAVTNAAKRFPKTVFGQGHTNCSDCSDLLVQIVGALLDAGWTLWNRPSVPKDKPLQWGSPFTVSGVTGVVVAYIDGDASVGITNDKNFRPTSEAAALVDALRGADLNATTEVISAQDALYLRLVPNGALLIMVGPKP